MGANLEIAGPVKRTEQGNVDYYYGGGDYAWPSKAAAVAGVPAAVRPGKVVGVVESGKVTEYIWHPDNLTDAGLTKVVTGDAGTVRMVTAGVSSGAIKAGDQVPVGTNATNADAFEKLVTASAAPALTAYTIYATSSKIDTMVAQACNLPVTGGNVVVILAAESGGLKQRIWIPGTLTLESLKVARFDEKERLSEFSADGSGSIGSTSGNYLKYNGTDRGVIAVTLFLKPSGGIAPATYVAAGYVAPGYVI